MMEISAVIPTYNALPYIEKSIMSIINQSEPVKEIIIIDDGSSDLTVEMVEQLKQRYECIKLFQQKNSGASAARNHGIEKAQGEWILFLDADDECDCSLVAKYTKFLLENDYDAVYGEFIQINEDSQKISDPFQGYPLISQDGFCQMLLRNPIISPSGTIVRKSVLDEVNKFDTSIKYVEDVDFWLRVLLNGKAIGHVAEPLSLIRRHTNNTTANIESTKQGEQVLLQKFGLTLIKEMIYKRERLVVENHFDYINFLIRFDKWQEANEILTWLDIQSTNDLYASFLFVKALVSLHFEEYSIAEELYASIITSQTSHGAALNNIGVLYAMNGDFEKAREAIHRALRHYPGYLDATYNLEQLEITNPTYHFTNRELRKNLLRYT